MGLRDPFGSRCSAQQLLSGLVVQLNDDDVHVDGIAHIKFQSRQISTDARANRHLSHCLQPANELNAILDCLLTDGSRGHGNDFRLFGLGFGYRRCE